VHLEPTAEGYEVRLRIDGLLEPCQKLDAATGRSYVNRLMVSAQLLTYRQDIPQEGRLSVHVPGVPGVPGVEGAIDLRLAVMPTTHALRAVVRLPAELIQPRSLEQLALPERAMRGLRAYAASDSGMLLLCGPAGSGKTTTIYALLQHIVRTSQGLSVIALEDPVERDLPGVTQVQVSPFGELTYEKVLRSMLRQDPQVLALGEIRDAQTASIAVQAALSGHRLISTLHAANPAGAIVRLIEMGIEPYQVASALFGIATVRLVRRLNPDADGSGDAPRYAGRAPLCEFAYIDATTRDAINRRCDTQALAEAIHGQSGYQTLADAARGLVERGVTDEPEVRRVLGPAIEDDRPGG
jgi:type II secretory ATPase GspE/PulE/Tfp pilus assembly ATPase PilB-like protein